LIIPAYGSAIGRSLNAIVVDIQVKVAMRIRGLGKRPDILITIPTAWDTAKRIPARNIVVNRSDKYSALPEADTSMVMALELQMLGACDAAVFVSHSLLDEEAPLVKRGKAVFLGHGVDVRHFAAGLAAAPPPDIASIPHPRIGFFGGLDDYVVDLDLIDRLADENPDLSIVLIGAATCSMVKLTSHPNIYWLGMKPYGQIPAYGAAFDVAIMPWLRNEWIERCNPIKVMEYLALGLPVVTMSYSEAWYLGDYLTIVDNADDFLKAVRRASEGEADPSKRESRRTRVLGESWQSRADLLREILETAGEH
jgi:glycosyltransferase involved in cell wall biosynthesis